MPKFDHRDSWGNWEWLISKPQERPCWKIGFSRRRLYWSVSKNWRLLNCSYTTFGSQNISCGLKTSFLQQYKGSLLLRYQDCARYRISDFGWGQSYESQITLARLMLACRIWQVSRRPVKYQLHFLPISTCQRFFLLILAILRVQLHC